LALLLNVLLKASTPSLLICRFTVCVQQGKYVGSERKEKGEFGVGKNLAKSRLLFGIGHGLGYGFEGGYGHGLGLSSALGLGFRLGIGLGLG
jgi:hypothetical protein